MKVQVHKPERPKCKATWMSRTHVGGRVRLNVGEVQHDTIVTLNTIALAPTWRYLCVRTQAHQNSQAITVFLLDTKQDEVLVEIACTLGQLDSARLTVERLIVRLERGESIEGPVIIGG